jgi:creatinine amidohydrolase
MPRPYLLEETPWQTVKNTAYQVAVLPWGATEAHNLHLPYGTDNIESGIIAAEAGRIAWEAGARVIVLPTVPFGVNTTQLDIPLTLSVNPSTQLTLLKDLALSLQPHVPKLLVLNGHGGNGFHQIIRELQPQLRIFLCALDWYTCVDAKKYFAEVGDHAGEMETSLMQHVAPEVVRPLGEAGSGATHKFRVRGLREGWAWAPREWTKATDDTGVGNPRAATPEKGAAYFTAVTTQIAGFLTELAAADPKQMYEQKATA